MPATDGPPLPIPTLDDREFYAAARRGELRFQRCASCGRFRHYPRPICPRCLSREYAWERASGRGSVFTWTIVRGPTQKQVWDFAKRFAQSLEALHPALVTAEYRISRRPPGRVLVDYNQNAWGRTLASIYSVRPRPEATVSTPVTWREIERGVRIEDFTMKNVPARVAKRGDLWKPLLQARGRVDLRKLVGA